MTSATVWTPLPDGPTTWWQLVAVYAVAGVFGYLVGSVNPATLVARLRGTDLRRLGSGNPGATNAGRVLGWQYGVLVGLLDVTKGIVAVVCVTAVLGDRAGQFAGLLAVVGHISSPWLLGRGGKGVATALGVILATHPLWVVPVLVVFGVVVAVTRNVGIASVSAALALVPTALLLQRDVGDVGFACALTLIVLFRHVRNLRLAWDRLRER